jgi:hypothetical protein
MTKLEINKKAIGKVVIVHGDGGGYWEGRIEDVKDENTFIVRDFGTDIIHEIDVFDVRYP